jgi:hypothetical protein
MFRRQRPAMGGSPPPEREELKYTEITVNLMNDDEPPEPPQPERILPLDPDEGDN